MQKKGGTMRDIVTTQAAPRSPFYSQAVRAAGLIFVSGQSGHDPRTGKFAGPTVGEQARQSLTNIKAILEAAGSSMDRIVNATFILRNPEDFPALNEEWASWFPEDPPARHGAALPVNVEGLLVSIAVTAAE
jgi:2-iminobutanoate/2-iminopropanoate deaminase